MSNSAWSKLAWPVKALIIVVPVAIFSYLAVSGGWFKSGKVIEPLAAENNVAGMDTGKPSMGETIINSAFPYLPEKPVDGKIKGVVEVGATGFNSFVVKIDQQKRWEIISKDFGRSLVYEGLATSDDINTGIKNYLSMMAEKGVNASDIHFLISSGAQKEPKTKTIAAELKKMGFGVKLVTAMQEGELALTCILPESYYEKAFVTDMGSGNSKISWMNKNRAEAIEAPGSKYFEKDQKDEAVFDILKAKASQVPKANREVCFILGGTPYDLAKQHRNGDERYTLLKSPEDYTPGNKAKTRAGLNIYKAIQAATGCKTFVFDWDANFAIGYLLNLPY